MTCILALFVLLLATAASANTEKAIFISPPAQVLPDSGPTFESLNLQTLTPHVSSLRLSLQVAFPTEEQPRGLESWYLLRALHEGQRQEVRVCWVATQPTNFWLDVFNTSTVFDTPELIQSLSIFSYQNQADSKDDPSDQRPIQEVKESLLFLRVQAAADFFTTNDTLMQSPPLVDVDLILDPYLGNLFPQSLILTACYILAIAGVGWVAAGALWSRLFALDKQHIE